MSGTIIIDEDSWVELTEAAQKSMQFMGIIAKMYKDGLLKLHPPEQASKDQVQQFVDHFETGLLGAVDQLEEALELFDPDE